jgi:hypothetical protein
MPLLSVRLRPVALALALGALLIGCDAPLAYDAWTLVAGGCALWSITGLTCVRVDREATLEVTVGDDTGPTGDTVREYGEPCRMRLRASVVRAQWIPLVGHELGHAMGIEEHLPPGNLMAGDVSAPAPTDADLDALAEVWGEAPWSR